MQQSCFFPLDSDRTQGYFGQKHSKHYFAYVPTQCVLWALEWLINITPGDKIEAL